MGVFFCVCHPGLHQSVRGPHHVCPDDEWGQAVPTDKKTGDHQWPQGATRSVLGTLVFHWHRAHHHVYRCSTAEIWGRQTLHLFFYVHSSVHTELIKKVLSLDGKIKSIANELYQQRSLLVMGRGFHYATCLEGALVSWDWQSSLTKTHKNIRCPKKKSINYDEIRT